MKNLQQANKAAALQASQRATAANVNPLEPAGRSAASEQPQPEGSNPPEDGAGETETPSGDSTPPPLPPGPPTPPAPPQIPNRKHNKPRPVLNWTEVYVECIKGPIQAPDGQKNTGDKFFLPTHRAEAIGPEHLKGCKPPEKGAAK